MKKQEASLLTAVIVLTLLTAFTLGILSGSYMKRLEDQQRYSSFNQIDHE